MNIRTFIAAAALVISAAGAANAQTFTLDWRVNGVNAVSVSPGSTVVVTAIASWNPGTYGLGGTQFRTTLAGADMSDVLMYTEAMGLGRSPLFRFGPPQVLTDSMSGGGRSITAAANAPIDAAQGPQFINPLFTTANPVEVFRFTLTAGAAGRTIDVGSQITGLTLVSNAMGMPVTTPYQRAVDGATISIVPTPGSLALLGLGGALTLRRKRK
ncbi:MAG: PEP-CTERM sorting domain-containing protein [Pyrinomonadaceae bacterium]|nr:PEP-CTERM sorting domain-containing protein [Phycisphaerales bacterium]